MKDSHLIAYDNTRKHKQSVDSALAIRHQSTSRTQHSRCGAIPLNNSNFIIEAANNLSMEHPPPSQTNLESVDNISAAIDTDILTLFSEIWTNESNSPFFSLSDSPSDYYQELQDALSRGEGLMSTMFIPRTGEEIGLDDGEDVPDDFGVELLGT
jgi:hypothetical protein